MTELSKATDNILIVNVAHIPFEDSRMLDEREPSIPTAPFQCGWFVPADLDALEGTFFSPAFKRVLQYAKELGYGWVRIDHDGPLMKDLPQFEWCKFNIYQVLFKEIYRTAASPSFGPNMKLDLIKTTVQSALREMGWRLKEDMGVCLVCGGEYCECP